MPQGSYSLGVFGKRKRDGHENGHRILFFQVVTDTFQAPEYWNVEHVALAKLAEVFVIAPATANIMAKMAAGIADDMLSTTVLATKAPVLLAPAMNTGMWTAAATQANLRTLQERGS